MTFTSNYFMISPAVLWVGGWGGGGRGGCLWQQRCENAELPIQSPSFKATLGHLL